MNTKKSLWALAVLSLFFAGVQTAQATSLITIGTDCGVGVWDGSTKTCTLSGDVAGPAYITINAHGVTLDGAGHTVFGGIVVNRFNHTTIKNLAFSGPGTSIDLEYAASTTLDNITTSNNTYGFVVVYSPDTTIVNSNIISPAGYGLYAYGDIPNLTLRNNHFSESVPLNWDVIYHNNIFFPFPLKQSTDQPQNISIDQSNTVDGKTIYYFENQSNRVFDNLPNAGVFYCLQCDSITLSNTTFDAIHNKTQINLYKTTNSIIKGNTVKYGRDYGVYLYESSGNKIEGNAFDTNSVGVESFLSTHNTYDKNIFRYGRYGAVDLNRGSADNAITHNDFTGNQFTIAVGDSATADITQNNFYSTSGGREIWIHNSTATTTISRALPVGGNYYQSYDAAAEGCADADVNGLCDSAYKVPAQYIAVSTVDFYPWTRPNGWETYHPPAAGFSNVLFLPGLEASRLYKQRSFCALGINCEDQLWEPNTNSDAVDLYLNPDGTSKNLGIYTRDIIKETNTPIALGAIGENIYKSFSGVMDGLVADKKIAEWWPYAYDWRQSVDDIVSNGAPYQNGQVSLVGTLQALTHSSKNGKVTIIAHSNGGLLAKALLKKLADDKAAGRNSLIDQIDTVILVASPQWGTPTAIPALLHGYDQDINPFFIYPFMNASTARELGRNMPAAYGLLPSKEYFNHISTPAVLFAPNFLDPYMSNEILKYGQTITSYDSEKNFLLGTDGRSDPGIFEILKPILGNNSLLARAESLHAAIDSLTLPASIRLVQIAGWGLDTVSGFKYSATTICSYATDNGCTGSYILDERPVFTADGDKTVVTPSALAMSGEKYWIDMNKYNRFQFPRRDHSSILEVSPLLNFVSGIIQNTPQVDHNYMSTTTLIDTQNRLRLSVHSPVTLDAYDINGNHTGKVCPPASDLCYVEENIPNSGYYEFGEGKYINVPEDQAKSVKLHGTDIGTFTFESQKVIPDSTATTTYYIEIPVTPQTVAEVVFDTATYQSKLSVDVNGDGVTDFIVSPQADFDPILYLEIMKKTIDSLDLSQSQKNNFDRKIDKIIALVQKGKLDKAKLKIENMSKTLAHKLAQPTPKNPRPGKLSKTDAQLLLDMLNQLLDNIR